MGIDILKRNKDIQIKDNTQKEIRYGTNETDMYAIFVLLEEKVDIVHNWLNQTGVYPIVVTDSIQDMADIISREQSKILLIVAESGCSLISSIHKRADMINLLGFIGVADIEIDVLYTDSALKADIRYALGKNEIKWKRYEGTKSIYKSIVDRGLLYEKGNKCEYRYDLSSLAKHKVVGIPPSMLLDWEDTKSLNYDSITDEFVSMNLNKDGESIRGYKVVI